MTLSNNSNQKYANLSFAKVYPMYVAKVEKKGRSSDEVMQVTTWLTGLTESQINDLIAIEATFADVFDAATLNPKAHLITGVICGHRVETIEDPLIQQVRYLDKLVDELAKGRKMDKILRSDAA